MIYICGVKYKRILLAEDDPLDAELTIQALKSVALNNDILHFKDGVELLDYLNNEDDHSPHEETALIITDIKMPRVDGITVLQTIRGNEKFDKVPVVVLSSSSQVSDVESCYSHHSNAFVIKPSGIDEFMESVRAIGLFWATVNYTT